jgi:hypothetical protein
MSDNDDDATPSSGHCCPNSTQKIKLEPGATDLPLPAKAQPMFVDLTISNSVGLSGPHLPRVRALMEVMWNIPGLLTFMLWIWLKASASV